MALVNFHTPSPAKPPCPFCQMMRSAMVNALVGMSATATVLIVLFVAYQNLSGV